jgi:hypothetical protein
MLNWKLIKNPLNWLIIILMLVLAGIGGHLLLSYFNHEPVTDDGGSQ